MGCAAVRMRLALWFWQMLLCLDQFAGCWFRGWYYVWIGGECPSSEETISSFVGRNSERGKPWAILLERLIDAIMGQGHCRRAIESQFKPNP